MGRKDSKQNSQGVLDPHHKKERQTEEGVGVGEIFRNLEIVQCNLRWNGVRRQVGIDRKEFGFHHISSSIQHF